MRVYAVFEPPARGADPDAGLGANRMKHAERFRFVRDGFSWPAFILTPLWMLRYRLWVAFALYAAICAAVGWGELGGRIPRGAETVVAMLLGLLIGFESATLRRRKLLRWGWRDLGIVAAENLQAAEQRFFDRWVMAAPASSSSPLRGGTTAPGTSTATSGSPASSSARSYDPDSYVIGMFPSPGAQP